MAGGFKTPSVINSPFPGQFPVDAQQAATLLRLAPSLAVTRSIAFATEPASADRPSFRPGPQLRNASAIRAFASVNRETTMPFSLSSYLLGVGTVVGALGF